MAETMKENVEQRVYDMMATPPQPTQWVVSEESWNRFVKAVEATYADNPDKEGGG